MTTPRRGFILPALIRIATLLMRKLGPGRPRGSKTVFTGSREDITREIRALIKKVSGETGRLATKEQVRLEKWCALKTLNRALLDCDLNFRDMCVEVMGELKESSPLRRWLD